MTDWLPAAFNDGHAYRDRVSTAAASTAGFYAERYTHSDPGVWGERLAAGQIWRNGQRLWGDGPLAAGDRLVWHRPPWQEPATDDQAPWDRYRDSDRGRQPDRDREAWDDWDDADVPPRRASYDADPDDEQPLDWDRSERLRRPASTRDDDDPWI